MRVDVRASGECAAGRAWRCVCACVGALAHVGRGGGTAEARSRGPLPGVTTSVIDVHTTNVCEHVNSLLSSERYSCVVNLGLFLFFSVFFFFPLFGSLGFLVFFGPFPPSLFMKLENLKDCCVSVNNKTIVHSVLVNVPRPNCYFWSPSPRGCSLCLMFPPLHPAAHPSPRCERVGPDPVLGVRPSHFNPQTPSSSG